MTGWMKSLAAAACLMTILMHLVPENRFAKYVRFYTGLLFFLLAVRPLLEFLGNAEDFERYLQLEFLKEEYYDLESAAEGLNDLKNDQIQEAYQNEMERQAAEIVSACGLTGVEVQMEYGEDGYSVEHVTVLAENADSSESTVAGAVSELAELYLIAESDVEVIMQEK